MRTRSRSRLRRGVGAAAGAVLAIAIVVAAALYVYSSSLRLASMSPEPVLRVLDEHLSQRVSIGPSAFGYYVLNSGSSPISVEYLVLRDPRGSITLVRTGRGSDSACVAEETVIPPGGLSTVRCGGGLALVAIVTSGGGVFVRDPRLTAPYLVQRAVPQRPLLTPEVASALEQYVERISEVRVSSSLGLVKALDDRGASVSIEANASLVVVLRSPSSPNLWSVLIAGYGAYGVRSNSRVETGSGSPLNLSRAGALRFRIKIENLSVDGGTFRVGGSDVSSPGVFPCVVNRGRQCWVSLSGTAGRVAVYVNGTSSSASVDPYPYYVTGDLDGNGYPEFLFITQDFGVGDRTRVNDREATRAGTAIVADSTVEPLRIVFTDAPINNTRYAVAVVSMRIMFWDSSLDDVSDNDNRIVVRVGVYDAEGSGYVYSVSLSYYELCRYRTVSPMTFSYVIKDFILYIPSPEEVGSKIFFVAIDVTDPYGVEGTRNDTEVILGIEYIALVLGARI